MRSTFLLCSLLLLVLLAAPAAAERRVAPGDDLQSVIDAAPPGAVIELAAGVHRANLVLNKPVRLIGEPEAILDGGGAGHVVLVRAPGVHLEGFIIRGSGHDLTAMDAGVFAEQAAADLVVKNLFLDRNGFGIWLDRSPRPRILGNRVRGEANIRSQDRGNGIHLFNVNGGEVVGNEVWEARDGIYIDVSNDNLLQDNYLHHLRYGLHYMYSQNNRVIGNRSHDNRLAFALMQSRNLTVLGNHSHNDGNYGFLLNYVTYSTFADNVITDVQRGTMPGGDGHGIAGAEGKAIFIYNSLFNEIRDNVFARSELGIHLTAGSEDNRIHGNSFLHNRTQVKYVANRRQEWSLDGRGNYWSDYLGWDLNEDGVGDVVYEPNDAIDKLLWRYPMARVLMNSPSIQVLRWAQRQFPVLRPPGVRDSAPLMAAPHDEDRL